LIDRNIENGTVMRSILYIAYQMDAVDKMKIELTPKLRIA